MDEDATEPEEVALLVEPTDMIEIARRRYGGAGAALAAGMFGLDIAIGTKVKPDSVQIQESPSDPVDVDADGIRVTIDERTSVGAPALERVPIVGLGARSGRRRHRRR